MMPNIVAVIVSAIVFMAIGFFWYSPMFLGTKWAKLKGYTKESLKKEQKKMGPKYVLSFIGGIISAFVLGWVINGFGGTGLLAGSMFGFTMWLGFVTTVQLSGWIFSSTKKELYFIDTGYQLVSFIIMGAILGVWK